MRLKLGRYGEGINTGPVVGRPHSHESEGQSGIHSYV